MKKVSTVGAFILGVFLVASSAIAASTLDSISVTAQSGTLTTGTAGSATYTVTVNRSGSGNMPVALSVTTALPSGVTSSFSPAVSFSGSNPTSATTTLTLTSTSGSPAGVTNFTIQAVGNAVTKTTTGTLTIAAPDVTPPVITLVGASPVTTEVGAVYTDLGATALDNVDGNITGSIVTTNTVNTAVVGSYTVTYNVHDAANNNAAALVRTVNVTDTTAPVITLNGSTPVTVQAGTSYTELGANATDNAGNFAATASGSVDVNTIGSYVITYTAIDASTNAATPVTRTVNVVDTTAPATPTIVSPLNNAIRTTAAQDKIDWTDVTDFSAPVAYVYSVSNSSATNIDGTFVTPLYTSGPLGVSEIPTPNTPEGEYYFIIKAVDALSNAGTWTVPSKVTIDNTAPVITVTGANPLTIEGGSAYVEAGAVAADSVDGSFAATASGSVDTMVVGSYTITYNATDVAGNIATPVTRTVIVEDTTKPVITVTGANPLTVEGATAYVELGATATDNVSAPVTVMVSGSVNTAVLGSYIITYIATDLAGNIADPVTRTVNVVDTTAPVVTVTGANPILYTQGNTYVELGATAIDSVDGVLPTTPSGVVDTATLGSYIVTYTATDLTGNAGTATRQVMVIPPDTTAPVITLNGSANVTVEGGSVYLDAGATAMDNVNGNITAQIVTVNPVNTSIVALYSVTYNVSDGAGNDAVEVTRNVDVVDTTKPVITLNGGNVSLHTGDSYTEDGAVVTDNVSTGLTATITGTVDTALPGVYVLSYDATDGAGNTAITVTRTVTVVDVAVPVITIVGSGTVTVEVGGSYTDDGATALDDVDGNITGSIVTVSNVNTAVLGAYSVTYDVTDSSLNNAIQMVRNVNVVDTTDPVITLVGSALVTLNQNDAYVDAGATVTDNYDMGVTVTTTGTVNTAVVGTYTITYTSTDASGNDATPVTRTVEVKDNTVPVITLIGSSSITIEAGDTYTDAGATATDDVDPVVTVITTGSVQNNVVGTYTLTYSAADTTGNIAVPVTRTVIVKEKPVTSSGSTGFGFAVSAPALTSGNLNTGTVLGEETFQFTIDLRLGMRNDDVKELQKRLRKEGFFTFPTDTGYFGPLTLAAVKAYQAAHPEIGFVTGFVGPLTRAVLNK